MRMQPYSPAIPRVTAGVTADYAVCRNTVTFAVTACYGRKSNKYAELREGLEIVTAV